MRLKKIYLLACVQSISLILIPSLSNFFTLGDRDRYLAFTNVDLTENINRTLLTDLIFNFGGRWLELGMGVVSIFLHFYLLTCFFNTLNTSRLNRLISITWLFLPVHFILRSIAGKELLASLLFCILILVFYPYLFLNINDSIKTPGNFFRRNKQIMFITSSITILFLGIVRPFFLLIFLLLLIPYLYQKIPFNNKSKKLVYLFLFVASFNTFLYFGINFYEIAHNYISLNFVGTGDSTFTNPSIPEFSSFYNYITFLFLNIINAITGPTNNIFLFTSIGPILLLEGLISTVPIVVIFLRNFLSLSLKPKFSLSQGFTNSITFLLLLLIYSLLGYVNFLAGWRLQSGSWILFILLYLKMFKK